MPTRKAIRKIINTYPICQSPLKRSARRGATRRCFAPLRKSRRNHRSMCEQKPYLATILLALLACVASVFNRVIARKVERELKTNRGGKGWGEKETFSPLPSPVIPFFQGSYRSWKTWKVMEFKNFIFHAWKVMEFSFRSWKVMGN